jgi:hypothetical protein
MLALINNATMDVAVEITGCMCKYFYREDFFKK